MSAGHGPLRGASASSRGGRRHSLLWRADEEATGDSWARLLPAHRTTGLWPVLLGGRRGRPWDRAPAPHPGSDPGAFDAEALLRWWWARHVPPAPHQAPRTCWEGTSASPRPRWPGLAATPPPEDDPDVVAARVAGELVEHAMLCRPRVGLVPAGRGADVLAAVGWTGRPGGCDGHDAAQSSAVLRSWEDRFGVRVVALEEHGVLHVSVAGPPRTLDQAVAVAAEHLAFCPDNVRRCGGTLARYAREHLRGRDHWSFRWG
ncbi:hypothetical protein AQ490_16005 [Wenjunlia vitaminophila]|uniref:DUF4253 domain-containing protein n=1 Tax=Wenjunlia vitaminophila TaxID=76728 RepID=A0A0T6LX40_WENVI|nr:hypothetical protein AQ490_16005 [Wenjunlia vitaminophila]